MFDLSTITRSPVVRSTGLLASGLALILAAGCGDDGLGKRYPVSGTVTYNGAPVAKASISFVPATVSPTGEQRGATGVVTDGQYTLSTQGGDDGAFPGDYLVTISGRTPDMSTAQANAGGGSARQDDVSKAFKKAGSAIPLKYESPESGGLKAKVEAKSQTINFELKD